MRNLKRDRNHKKEPNRNSGTEEEKDEMKIAIDSINITMYQAEKRICEIEDRKFEVILTEIKEKRRVM